MELREHVGQKQQRRKTAAFRDQLRLCQQQREHREPLLTLRPEAAEIARAAGEHDVVEMWPEARRTTLEVAVEPPLEGLDRRRVALVDHPCLRANHDARAVCATP